MGVPPPPGGGAPRYRFLRLFVYQEDQANLRMYTRRPTTQVTELIRVFFFLALISGSCSDR